MSDMTQQQLRNVAIGFLHVLRTQDSVYEQSMQELRTGDFAQLGQFIAKVMHLQSVPTAEEVQQMDDYLYENMPTETAALKAVRPAGPAMFSTFSHGNG